MRSIAQDLGLTFRLRVFTDATAAIGICRRKSLGKVRHRAVADLWVQDKIRAKDFGLLKIARSANPADMMTKHVDQATLARHLENLGLRLEHGRADSAPELTHAVVLLDHLNAWCSWPVFRRR